MIRGGRRLRIGRWLCTVLTLACTTAAIAQDKRPSGGPKSAHERMVEEKTKSVEFSVVYTSEIDSNVSGGRARGVHYLDNLDLQVAADADRLIGWRGARAFVYLLYNNGTTFSKTLVGDVQFVSNIETDVRALRVFEAWIEQDIGRSASVKAGLYNLNSEFDTIQAGGLFLLSSHGIGPDPSQSGQNGPSIFPVTSLAVRGELRIGQHWHARVAVLDGVPGDPDRPARTAVKLSGRDGALIIGEVDYRRGGTKVAIGGWTYTARFDDVRPGAPSGRGNRGGYALIEHRLRGAYGDDPQGLAGWLRFGLADPRFNPIVSYLGAGIVQTGIGKRRADQIGIAVAVANFSARSQQALAQAGTPSDAREVILEATYKFAIADWLSVQPDLQYVINPGGQPAIGDATVIGLRFRIGR